MSDPYQELQERARVDRDAWEGSDRPRILVQVAGCSIAAGALDVLAAVRSTLQSQRIAAHVAEVGCMGLCFAEVLVDIIVPGRPRITYGLLTPQTVPQLLTDYILHGDPRPDLALGTHGDGIVEGIPPLADHSFVRPQLRVLSRNFGHVEPGNLLQYVARGGYRALDKALSQMTPEEVRHEVETASLRGRGGALFPAATKWGFMMNAPHPKYLAVNGEEGDPGAFTDTAIFDNDPHILLEGALLAAYAMACDKTYVHIRAEYRQAVQRLRRALRELEQAGLVGEKILGSDFSHEIEIEATGHAYICGEETALMDSVEGKRGLPRPRPPFPATYGIFGRPTNVNNVKTLSYVPSIVEHGGEWFKSLGTEAATGTAFLSLSGDIARRGFAEVPLGTPIREVFEVLGGGTRSGAPIKGIQTGGPLGGAAAWDALRDLPLEFGPMDGQGAPLGSGGLLVLGQDACAVDLTTNLMEFNEAESCGKCFPCRKGTGHIVRTLKNIQAGLGRDGDLRDLVSMGETMSDGSLCGLGQLAPRIIHAMLRHFPHEFEAHVIDKRCPTGTCAELARG